MNTKVYTIILTSSMILTSCSFSSQNKNEISKNITTIGGTQDITTSTGGAPTVVQGSRN